MLEKYAREASNLAAQMEVVHGCISNVTLATKEKNLTNKFCQPQDQPTQTPCTELQPYSWQSGSKHQPQKLEEQGFNPCSLEITLQLHQP